MPAAPVSTTQRLADMAPELLQLFREMSGKERRSKGSAFNPFKLPDFPPHALPPQAVRMAMDDAITDWASTQWTGANGGMIDAYIAEGLAFPGYTYLAELMQRSEFRVLSETIAEDSTRAWIDYETVSSKKDPKEKQRSQDAGGDPDDREKRLKASGKLDKVKALRDEQERLDLRNVFYNLVRDDGAYGRTHLFTDLGDDLDIGGTANDELTVPIGNGRDDVSKAKVAFDGKRGKLAAFRTVEPVWCYPTTYNAMSPLRNDYYNPQVWYVMGQNVAISRLRPFVTRPVPDILKAAYAFGGIAMSQLAEPYVNIWLQTRQSVANLVKAFSTTVLMADLAQQVTPGGQGAANLIMRSTIFNAFRDNLGLFVVDKNKEDVKNVAAPLGGLDHLQAQSQEHMACLVAGTLVETDQGQVTIEKVTLKHRVMTRTGLAPLCWVGQTGVASRLVEIRAGDAVLRATEWHPIWSQTTREFVAAENVDRSHRLLRSTNWESTAPRSHGAVAGGGRRRTATTGIRRLAASFIDAFTRRTSDLSRRASTFITAMRTLSTTAFPTLSFSPALNTTGATWRTGDSASTATAPSTARSASNAGISSRPSSQGARSSAPSDARARGTSGGECEIDDVRTVECPPEPVYNLEVAEGFLPEFFANGVLVHNSVGRQPLVKLTGISPSGLNATSEFEIKVYDDTINAFQNRRLRTMLNFCFWMMQLNLFGEVDPEITYDFAPLRQMTESEKAEKEEREAKRDQIWVDVGAISSQEVRERIINDPELPYGDLDPDEVPEPPAEEGLLGPGAGKGGGGGEGEAGGGETERPGGAADVLPFGSGALDAHWFEDDHPRAPDGKFGRGGGRGGSAGGAAGKERKEERQHLRMPQYGLSRAPSSNHQPGAGFSLPPRKPAPKSSGDPRKADGLVVFEPGKEHAIDVGGPPLKSWTPPDDWEYVEGQADVGEPPVPRLPEGMTLSSGVIIREPDGRVWVMRPSKGFGGYDQTFPKGGVEKGLSMQANAIKEAYEETGLKVRITGFAGDHEGDTTVSRYYLAEREGGDPRDAGWEAEGVILAPPAKLGELLNRKRDKDIAATLAQDADFVESEHPRDQSGKFSKGGGGSAGAHPISTANLQNVGAQKGSNPGGVYHDAESNKDFYVKKLKSKSRAANETLAANLFKLAGGNTLEYHEVKSTTDDQGKHVATLMAKLDKANLSKLNEQEKKAAQKDFVANAWLANWDAAGTGGDNVGVVGGKVTTLDFGGALAYRAQGEPKGAAFGNDVPELASMKNPQISPDNAKLYGSMTATETRKSAEQVTNLTNDQIIDAVKQAGGTWHLAEKLIARKNYIADQFNLPTDKSAWDDGKHPRNPDGTFKEGAGEVAGEQPPVASGAGEEDGDIPKPGAYGGLWKGKGDDPKADWLYNAGWYSTAKAQLGIHYRRMMAKILKDADQYGISAESKNNIKGKLIESLQMSAAKAQAQGKTAEVDKLNAAIAKLYGTPAVTVEAPAPTKGIAALKKYSPKFAAEVEAVNAEKMSPQASALKKAAMAHKTGDATAHALGESLTPAEMDFVTKTYGTIESAWKAGEKILQAAEKAATAVKEGKAAPAAPAPAFPPPTEAELTKAKKNVALQLQYVPGAPQTPAAQKLVDAFNAKYAGKEIADKAGLAQKVNDFKALQAAMAPLMSEEQKAQAQKAAENAKKQAAAAEEAKKQAAAEATKLAAQMNDPEVKKQYETLQDVFNGKMVGFTSEAKGTIAKHKLGITPYDGAFIIAYRGSAYTSLNEQLRQTKMVPDQYKYAKALDNALRKMPVHSGYCQRGVNLSASEHAKYEPGLVVIENQFTSAGKKQKLWGQWTIDITSKSAADISSFNPGEGGGEVIFPMHSSFKVVSKDVANKRMVWEEV